MGSKYAVVVSIAFTVNLGTFVTLDTPFHGKWRILIYFLHFLNLAVASLAFYCANCNVLRMVKVSQIWQVVYTHPLDWF